MYVVKCSHIFVVLIKNNQYYKYTDENTYGW